MRREDLRLVVSNVGWLDAGEEPAQPTLAIHASVPSETLVDVLSRPSGDPFEAGDVDVTFRFQDPDSGGPTTGVVAVANRVTGEFLLEVNADVEEVMTFVAAARRYAEDTEGPSRYRVTVIADGEVVTDVEKRTLLVYAEDGELLREQSLIPSGVEI